MSQHLALNPNLDIGAYAKTYAEHGIVRIADVLAPDSAEAVARLLEKQIPWRLALFEPSDPQGGSYDQARINALGPSAMNARVTAVFERARKDFAFVYLTYAMIEAYLAGQDPGHPIHQVSEFLNGPAFLGLLRAVTGRQEIVKAEAFATLYRPGDFLTWHDDAKGATQAEKRICAYTLGFTRGWRPDWGGQLLFHEKDGHITQGLMPAFNCLSLFTVPRYHSVAQVAAYAGAPRISIAGWGRSDLPAKGASPP